MRGHPGRAVRLARRAGQADLGYRTDPAASHQFQRRARHQEMGHRPGGGVAHERGPLAVRRGGQQRFGRSRARATRPRSTRCWSSPSSTTTSQGAGMRPPRRTSRPTGRRPATTGGPCRSVAGSAKSSRSGASDEWPGASVLQPHEPGQRRRQLDDPGAAAVPVSEIAPVSVIAALEVP